MPKPSKENQVLEIFFNNPSKHWHFDNLVKELKMSRSNVSKWINKFKKEDIIKRIKPKDKMPYFVCDSTNPNYKSKKRIYALNKFYDSGFLNHLQSIKEANTIIIFGSFARSDWYKNSDIDLFIYGDDKELNVGKYEKILKREIQLFTMNSKKDIKKFNPGLLRSIIKGNIIKGNIPNLIIKNAAI